MDNQQIDGIGQQVKGALKRAVGRMIGDAKLPADGAAEETNGEAQLAAAPSSGLLMGIDADRIKGVAHQLEGAVKQGIGSLMADPGLRQSGIDERKAGKVQNARGGARDTAREGLEKQQ